ncbi:unnamed protein product, partial [Adineta steineri]
MHAHFAPPLQ